MQNEALIAERVLLVWLIGLVIGQRHKRELKRWWKTLWAQPKRKWTLRPRTPDNCMDCRLAQTEQGPSWAQGPRPWREVKSKRGRPKQHDSSGHACMNTACEGYKVTDAAILLTLGWATQRG